MFYLQVIQTKEVKFIPLGIFVFFFPFDKQKRIIERGT